MTDPTPEIPTETQEIHCPTCGCHSGTETRPDGGFLEGKHYCRHCRCEWLILNPGDETHWTFNPAPRRKP